MANREVALALAAAGIAVFPCQSRGSEAKKPLRGVYWRKVSTTDERQIERWWGFTPDALPAIDMAKAGLVAIDLDAPVSEGDADGVTWFARELAAPHQLDTDALPRTVSGRGGQHLFFRQPGGLGNGRGSLPPKNECGVDVRGAGGYVIAPGAELPDGRRYVGHGSIADAPPMPDWLVTILRKEAGEPIPTPEPSSRVAIEPRPDNDARLSAYAQAGIERELAALRTAPKGSRNPTLNDTAFNLGQMVGAGWIAESEAQAWLEDAAAACGLTKDDGIRQVRATIRSGMTAGRAKPRSLPPEIEPASALNGAAIARALLEKKNADGSSSFFDPDTGEEVEYDGEERDERVSIAPDVPGLVGMVANWITATARRPQPSLSLGAALTVCGTAIGRSLAGPTLSATHLYVIALAPTGAGKDHPLQQSLLLMRAAGMGHHIGPSEFISMPAVINFLMRKPLSLCAMDEFGAFVKRINSRKASGFEGAISKILRTAWGVSFKPMMTPEWAGKTSEPVMAPALSIYGTSTEEEFYGAMEGSDQDNGVLNRFLLFSSPIRPPERDPLTDPFDVPKPIIDGLTRLYTRDGVIAAALRNSAGLDVDAATLPWGLDEGRKLYDAFRLSIEAQSDADPIARPFLARTVEMALRIATIIAAGRFCETVDAADFAIGRDLATQSAELMVRGARDHIAESDTQAASNRVVRIIRKFGGKVRRTALLQAMRHLKARELNDLLVSMTEAELILTIKGDTSKVGGRPEISYALPR